MKRVTGIGGIFFKAKEPEKLQQWYREHLDVETVPEGGASFRWRHEDQPERVGMTVWSVMAANTTYFGESTSPFMINYRVADLDALLETLKKEGVPFDGRIEEHDYGRFAWITDPEGNRIELWEPANE